MVLQNFILRFLRTQELKDFYEMMPEKFNNKTNGITQRRFLLHGNPLLANWVTDHIGDELDHRSVQDQRTGCLCWMMRKHSRSS